MISQVLDHFKSLIESGTLATFDSENMTACFDDLREVKYDFAPVVTCMQRNGIEPWMSGLACGRVGDCCYDVDLITAVPPRPSEIDPSSKDKNCPPNCNCDNPWAFIR